MIPELPEMVAGEWKRIAMETPATDAAPEVLRTLGVRHWVRAAYIKPGERLSASVFAMPAQASAFEARPRWRNEQGSLAFDRDNLFVVLTAAEGIPDLRKFSIALEQAWSEKPR
jgi:hypothetical protein